MSTCIFIQHRTYKITCITTNQYYIGSRYAHTTNSTLNKDDLGIIYKGSSANLNKLIKEHGIDNFRFEILFEFNDYEVCFTYENILIKDKIKQDDFILNKWFMDPDKNTKHWYKDTPETKKKKSLAKLGKPSNAKGHIQTQEHIDKCNKSRAINQQSWSQEKRDTVSNNISKSLKGKARPYAANNTRRINSEPFMCCIYKRKEYSRNAASRWISELKHLFP